jgi:hypothetical protein
MSSRPRLLNLLVSARSDHRALSAASGDELAVASVILGLGAADASTTSILDLLDLNFWHASDLRPHAFRLTLALTPALC